MDSGVDLARRYCVWRAPTGVDLVLGAVGGCVNAFAYALLVEGMRRRTMGAVIPPSAVAGALLPVIVGVGMGDILSWVGTLGIVAALSGAALASSEPRETESTDGEPWWRRFDSVALAFGVTSGLGFGLMFVLLSLTAEGAGLWPIVAMRASIPLLLLLARLKGVSLAPTREVIRLSFGTSLAAATAIACFTVAARRGPLSVVTAIASTSTAGTVVVAQVIGHERMSRVQLIGAVIAVVGVVLLTLR